MSKYEVKFRPKCFEAEGAGYDGTVTVRLPDWEKRSEILETTGCISEDVRDKLKSHGGLHHMTRALAKFTPDLVAGVDVTRKADGVKLTTWEDVRHEGPLAKDLIPELAWWPIVGTHLVQDPSKPN